MAEPTETEAARQYVESLDVTPPGETAPEATIVGDQQAGDDHQEGTTLDDAHRVIDWLATVVGDTEGHVPAGFTLTVSHGQLEDLSTYSLDTIAARVDPADDAELTAQVRATVWQHALVEAVVTGSDAEFDALIARAAGKGDIPGYGDMLTVAYLRAKRDESAGLRAVRDAALNHDAAGLAAAIQADPQVAQLAQRARTARGGAPSGVMAVTGDQLRQMLGEVVEIDTDPYPEGGTTPYL